MAETGETTAPPDPAVAFHERVRSLTPRVWVTPAIIAINVAVYAVMVARGMDWIKPSPESMIDAGANFRPLLREEAWRLVTSMFLHYGAIHLAMNMLVLAQIGGFVERLIGNVGFLLLYLTSGVLASVASAAWNANSASAGASGAVFGAYGMFLGFLLRSRGTVPAAVWKRLLNGALVFIVYNIGFGMLPGIDQAAHLGGLAAGFVAGLAVALPLEPASRPRRLRRAVLVALAGFGVAAAAVATLPRGVNWRAEIESANAIETRLNEKVTAAVKKLDAKEVSKEDFAKMMRGEVLAEWRALRDRLAGLSGAPDSLPKVLRYLDLKAEGWSLFAEAVESEDAAKAEAAGQKMVEAEGLLKN
jgi:membrane associated rhomboid family serine protease